jgi:integrase/recombinase XerD
MFEQIFRRRYYVARHASAPYPEERKRYLAECARRGDAAVVVRQKAEELYWVAHRLSVYGNLFLTGDQIKAAAVDCDWRDRERDCSRKLNQPATRARFVVFALRWLRFLGCLRDCEAPIPFQPRLEQFCRWAREERGFAETTVNQYLKCVRLFLRWYGALERPLSRVRIHDIDAYLSHGSEQGWCRITVSNIVAALRAFFRYGASKGWAPSTLANGIYGPPIYSFETLPAGPAWTDVQRLLADLDTNCPKNIRDRAILMLFAIYGLREREVAQLRLDHLDWEHDLLHVPRAKRRETHHYPLVPSVGNALIRYLQTVRRPLSPHRQLFLTLPSPYGPMSPAALYYVASCKQNLSVLRSFYRYVLSRKFASTSPLPASLPKIPPSGPCYIYTPHEIKKLLAETASLRTPKAPWRGHAFRTLLLLLYGTGLRIGEALALTLRDVDLRNRVITVRNAKCFKQRLVPCGPKLNAVLCAYTNSRRRLQPLPGVEESSFFANSLGTRWDLAGTRKFFRQICLRAEVIRDGGPRRQPRLHDLRHTAAQHRVEAWYREGRDVQLLLPKLATYLGHVGIGELQCYHMTPELLREASLRFERYAKSKS